MKADTRLLAACATLALLSAAPGLEQEAAAQGFQGDPGIVAGTVNITRAPGADVIRINSPSAIINWQQFAPPTGADPIVFLPAGNSGLFTTDVPGNTFAVLNRILPVGDARIMMDGKVASQILNANGGFDPGGTVIFYSPTGIILGANASFDVGNLLLTTLDPALDAAGRFFVDGRIRLGGGGGKPFPNAAIETRPGAQVVARAEGSWVAFAAPRIVHAGNVAVNGSAAYVGAEAVELVIDQGLFDINISIGSTADNPIVHSGTSGGPASLGGADGHGIYMVAAGQQPITMLLSGNAGFAPATNAAIENGAIILSAGHNVVRGQIERAPTAFTPATIRITAGTFTSDVTGQARTEIFAGDAGPGTLTFEQDLRISAFEQASLSADRGFRVRVGGNAFVSAANTDPILFDNLENVVAGTAAIFAGGGARVDIVGSALVDASARGGIDVGLQVGSGRGGTARVNADKGVVDIGGTLTVLAVGSGADGAPLALAVGGDGTGGTALVSALGGSSLRIGGNARLDASGRGGSGTGAGGGTGATGRGGTARIEATAASTVAIGGTTLLSALGFGGSLGPAAGTIGGSGQGGDSDLLADGGNLDLGGATTFEADGAGGGATAGGTGRGGGANATARDGRIAIAGTFQASSNGAGGIAADGGGGRGGDGVGGAVNMIARSGTAPGILAAPTATLRASGTGGSGGTRAGGPAGGRGGDGRGGQIVAVAEAQGGQLQPGTLNAVAHGTGGRGNDPGGAGGNGAAGSITAGTVPGAAGAGAAGGGPVTGRADFAAVNLAAIGAGGNGNGGAAGGSGTGGSLTLAANQAPVTVTGTANLQADGTAGNGAAGQAGRWRVAAQGGAILRIGQVVATAAIVGNPAGGATSEIEARDGSSVRIGNTGNFATHGDIAVNVQGSGQIVGGEISLDGRTGIALSHAAPPAGALTIDSTGFTATTAAAYAANPGTSVSGRDGITIRAGTDATLADTRTTANLSVTAGAAARFRGAALGRQIDVTSRDIEVAAGAQIGNAATILAALNIAANPQSSLLGGGAQGPGYTLTQAEAGRIRADLLRVTALPGAGASTDILVGDLTLAGITAFEALTPALLRVEGGLLLANPGAAGRIAITAGRLEVVTPNGSIRVRDAAGAPVGTLDVAAANIWVAEAALLARLRADPNFAGRDQALRTNQGADTPRGNVEADRIRLAPAATLYVQNSGIPSAFAGLTVGPGGLEIAPAGGQPASVTAFGRRLNRDGSVTTNIAFFREVNFNRVAPPRYRPEAEFNRCIINTGICRAAFVGLPGDNFPAVFGPFLIPPQAPPGDPLDTSAFLAEPLIEEPVTSGGDSTLWTGPDEDDDDDQEQQ